MIHRLLNWSLPAQILLLVIVLLLVGQQGGDDSSFGPFPAPPRADQVIGETRTVRLGFGIVDELRYGGLDRGNVVLSEGRLAQARAHRVPAVAMPVDISIEGRSGRLYRFRLLAANAAQLTLTIVGVVDTGGWRETGGG